MKRLILFLGLFLSALFVQAQWSNAVDYGDGTTQRTALQRTLPKGVTYFKYKCVAADTTGSKQDSLFFEILANKNTALTCNARLEFDTIKVSDEKYAVTFQGKVFENDTWTSIKAETNKVTSLSLYEPETSMVDSTGVPNAMIGSGDNFYRYFRILIANDGTVTAGSKAVVSYAIFKLYER